MKKSFLVLSLSALASISCLASCGGNNGPKDKYQISISARSSFAEQDMLKIWKKAYEEKHPQVEIIIDGWGSSDGTSQQYIQKNALNRANLTNIIYTTDDTTALLAQKNNFVDLRPYYEADPETDYTKYYESMLHTTAFNGEFRPTTNYTGEYAGEKSNDKEYGVYFAPREYNMPGLILNKKCFQEYGIAIPDKETWCWDKFVELLTTIDTKTKELAQTNNVYKLYRGIELNHTWEPVYTSILKELGGNGLFKFDDEYEASSNIDSPENIAAFKKIISAFGNGARQYTLDRDASAKNFINNMTFMAAVSYPEVGNFNEVIKDFEFLPFPTEYVSAGCGGYGILTDKVKEVQKLKTGETAKTVDLCWDFIKFIISEEGQNLCGKKGYIQPVLKSLEKTGDWVTSYNENLDHSAFAHGKELRLDTFTFATPDKRNNLRNDIVVLMQSIFAENTTEADITAALTKANTDINKHLKNK